MENDLSTPVLVFSRNFFKISSITFNTRAIVQEVSA